MSGMQWVEQLKEILDSPLQMKQVKTSEWRKATSHDKEGATSIQTGTSICTGDYIWFCIRTDGKNIDVLEIEANHLKDTERALIEWSLGQFRPSRVNMMHEPERLAEELGQWITAEVEKGELQSEVPDSLTMGGRLFSEMIPFLLVSEQAPRKNAYSELEKLLKSFFEEEVLLIPLKEQEWLILGPSSLLHDADNDERNEESEESEEELLASMCSGLHGMLASEWIGECHLAVGHPGTPAKSIIETSTLLRETVYLGRKFHVGANIHLPWRLHLERLLNSIPEHQRGRFMEQLLNRSDVMLEPEILMTLETFFGLDCNVSETAKKLYIHRNTLLYRLDKLKQETGLDVRVFSEAVLVKIILLLYKVTKWK
ncbi:PucR family transcriptional regulator [Paenibacillus tarimensis]